MPIVARHHHRTVVRRPLVAAAAAAAAVFALGGCRYAVIDTGMTPVDLAVIGDNPYGQPQFDALPRLVDSINADASVSGIMHVGDIKAGAALCTDAYFDSIKTSFLTFEDPVMFTPGDNEWTDCWKSAGGGYWPQERLERLREVFHTPAGLSVGGDQEGKIAQEAVVQPGYPENQMWMRSDVVLSMIDLPGSNNATERWYGGAATPAQIQAQDDANAARDLANRSWLTQTFTMAVDNDATAVVLVIQADMFAGTSAIDAQYTGFTSFVQALAPAVIAYGKPVLLVNGDSHGYATRKPMASGSTRYGVVTPVPNLTQVTVKQSQTLNGDGTVSYEWLELHIDPNNAANPFTWTRVQGT